MRHLRLGRDHTALLAAVLAPFGVSTVLVPFRESFANTDAALVLVLVVVAVAANGQRLAGIIASVSGAVWFDFFLTAPYEHFSITHRTDIETTVLLLVIGVGVSELAVWARRQQSLASRQSGYLIGLHDAAAAAAAGESVSDLIGQVSEQLTRLLGLEGCRFQRGVAGLGHPPRLLPDGRVLVGRNDWDVERRGLPAGQQTELLVENGGVLQGRFLLSATAKSRSTCVQRLIAVALADQVGAALAGQRAASAS